MFLVQFNAEHHRNFDALVRDFTVAKNLRNGHGLFHFNECREEQYGRALRQVFPSDQYAWAGMDSANVTVVSRDFWTLTGSEVERISDGWPDPEGQPPRTQTLSYLERGAWDPVTDCTHWTNGAWNGEKPLTEEQRQAAWWDCHDAVVAKMQYVRRTLDRPFAILGDLNRGGVPDFHPKQKAVDFGIDFIVLIPSVSGKGWRINDTGNVPPQQEGSDHNINWVDADLVQVL